jgi:uncharacterized protein
MFEISFFLVYLCLITALQSSMGVGILVLGTPFLLILDYNIVEVFFILLPLSIKTSLINLIIMRTFNKKLEISSYKELKKFFIICIPSIILGLIILKIFQDYINFKKLVSIVIILSIGFVMMKDKIKFRINFFRITILSVVGVIHGLTNSGGTLMSLALSSNNKKNYARFNITFFYFVLASFQYLIISMIFYDEFIYQKNINLIWVIPLGILLGNVLNNYIDEKKYKISVNILAIISSLFLLVDNL